jgi:hypothetical protein
MSNTGNHAHRNRLSKVAINPRRETAAVMNGSQTAPVLQSPVQMMDRVQKRVLDKFLDSTTTPQTKRFAVKVHTQLAHKDATFTSVVEHF